MEAAQAEVAEAEGRERQQRLGLNRCRVVGFLWLEQKGSCFHVFPTFWIWVCRWRNLSPESVLSLGVQPGYQLYSTAVVHGRSYDVLPHYTETTPAFSA